MLDAGADQKGDPRSAKSRKGRGKRESARPAFRRILFRQPQRINRKIRATTAKKEKANKEPRQRGRPEIENLSKRERSEEHTSELQSQSNLVCRLLLEKKKVHLYHRTALTA